MAQHVTTDLEDGVLTVTLDRAPSNALSRDLLRDLRETLESARDDRAVRAIVLSTALDKYFSSGLDLDEVTAADDKGREDHVFELIRTYVALAKIPKPTVAAIRGYALLGGYILALACDYRLLAADNGRVALSEIRVGLSPTGMLIGAVKQLSKDALLLRRLVLEGRTLKASEAVAGGFVDELIPGDAVLAEAQAQAKRLCKLAPKTFAMVKRDLDLHGTQSFSLEKVGPKVRRMINAPEAKEGLLAAKEKRKAQWEVTA